MVSKMYLFIEQQMKTKFRRRKWNKNRKFERNMGVGILIRYAANKKIDDTLFNAVS